MLESFIFSIPTKIYFGRKQEDNIGHILKELGAKKVLVVYGMGSIVRSGLLSKVKTLIQAEEISIVELGGVRSNPTIDFVRKGIQIAREENIDFILAIGGGSAIDAAKLIATGFYYHGDPFEIVFKNHIPTKVLPLGVIVTIAASGSEASASCVIQDDISGIKRGFNSELNRPVFAIENPELTFSVSKEQTAFGIVDIFMHTVERYLSLSNGEDEISDRFGEQLMKLTLKSGLVAFKNPNDYDARANLLLLSSLSHCGLTSIGKKYLLTVHQLEHILSGLYPSIAHGAGLAALFPSWAEYYLEENLDKFNLLAKNVFDLDDPNKKSNASKGIEKLVEYFRKIEVPLSYKELGIESPDINKMVEMLNLDEKNKNSRRIQFLDSQGASEIYKSLLKERKK